MGLRNVIKMEIQNQPKLIIENISYGGGYMEYYENEMIKVTGKYRRGKKQGRWQYYDKDGKLLKTEKYKRGNLISQIEYPSPKKNRVTKHIVPRENGLPYTLK